MFTEGTMLERLQEEGEIDGVDHYVDFLFVGVPDSERSKNCIINERVSMEFEEKVTIVIGAARGVC